jgi:predicted ABC-type ATPase
VFDNSGDAHRLVAEITNGEQMELHTDTIPAWFASTKLWQSFQR